MKNDIAEVTTASKQEVSYQIFQDVYHTLTGKTERLSKTIYHTYEASCSQLENLNEIVRQAAEQYNVTESLLSVVVSYADGKTERHSGLGRFLAQAGRHAAPVETIDLIYDFLIVLPKTKEPKPYKIRVGVRSTLAMVNRLSKKKISDFERQIFADLDSATGVIDIRYIDYTVAKTFETHLVSWFDGLPRSRGKRAFDVMSVAAPAVGVFVRSASLIVAAYLMINSRALDVVDERSLFKAGVAAFVGIMTLNILVHAILDWASNMKIHFKPVSFICLSDCDKAAKRSLLRTKLASVFKAAAVYVTAIAMGVLANYASRWLGI